MFNAHQLRAATVRMMVILILLSGAIMAQGIKTAPQTVQSQDAFAGWHATLNEAADRTLAAALADKRWMQTPEVPTSANSTVPIATDPLVRFRTAVERVQQLRPTIEPVLRQEGVPSELSAIVLVESGGLTTALSPKGARGAWQFMPDTARRYGLTVTAERDERNDVAKSTRAAARYLHDLYRQFGDWRLAFAAYNAGEQRIDRALAGASHRGYLDIETMLPQETRDYVPAVVDAIAVLGNSAQFVLGAPAPRASQSGRVLFAPAGGTE